MPLSPGWPAFAGHDKFVYESNQITIRLSGACCVLATALQRKLPRHVPDSSQPPPFPREHIPHIGRALLVAAAVGEFDRLAAAAFVEFSRARIRLERPELEPLRPFQPH